MNINLQNCEIKVRLSSDLKESVTRKAKDAGISLSEYVRLTLNSNEKVILLTEGGDISKHLFSINEALDIIKEGNMYSSNELLALITKIETLNDNINTLVDKISDISGENEEEK